MVPVTIRQTLIIGFVIFFSIQLLFISIIDYRTYQIELKNLDEIIRQQIEICSLKLECEDYKIEFTKKKPDLKPLRLYKRQEVFMLFALPQSQNYYLKIALDKARYRRMVEKIRQEAGKSFLLHVFAIVLSSFLFSYLLLIPIRRSYRINTSFIKDILHDFNTPLSTLKINLYMLKSECSSPLIERMEKNIQTILNLQKNLKAFIAKRALQIEEFDIVSVLEELVAFYRMTFPAAGIEMRVSPLCVRTDRFGFERIVDNLLSNAFKYNKKNGTVRIYLEGKRLIIEDEGKGIKDPTKAFERFYKEQERGMGLGLNIVRNFSQALNIPVTLRSSAAGTKLIVDLGNVQCDQ